jgi:ATP-dependent Clp protease ATP-binding subunit ClpA
MFERFTTSARNIVRQAQDEARKLGHTSVGPEHMLLALATPPATGESQNVAYEVLSDAGLDYDRVLRRVIQLGGSPAKLLSDEDASALATIGIDFDAVLERVESSFGPGAFTPKPGRVGFSKDAKTVLQLSLREAIRRKSNRIGAEHLLLGLLRKRVGIAGEILDEATIRPAELRVRIEAAIATAA